MGTARWTDLLSGSWDGWEGVEGGANRREELQVVELLRGRAEHPVAEGRGAVQLLGVGKPASTASVPTTALEPNPSVDLQSQPALRPAEVHPPFSAEMRGEGVLGFWDR